MASYMRNSSLRLSLCVLILMFASRLLSEAAAIPLPDQELLAGTWQGLRRTSGFLRWHENSNTFSAGCLDSEVAEDFGDFGYEVEHGKLTYNMTLEIEDGPDFIQLYKVPMGETWVKSADFLIGGLEILRAGYNATILKYSTDGVVYEVSMDNGLLVGGCLDWRLELDSVEKAVILKQVELFKAVIRDGNLTIYSDTCTEGKINRSMCFDSRKETSPDMAPSGAPANTPSPTSPDAASDYFSYCSTATGLSDTDQLACTVILYSGLAGAIAYEALSGTLSDDDPLYQCYLTYTSNDNTFSDTTCLDTLQQVAAAVLSSEQDALDLCTNYVTVASCAYCKTAFGTICDANHEHDSSFDIIGSLPDFSLGDNGGDYGSGSSDDWSQMPSDTADYDWSSLLGSLPTADTLEPSLGWGDSGDHVGAGAAGVSGPVVNWGAITDSFNNFQANSQMISNINTEFTRRRLLSESGSDGDVGEEYSVTVSVVSELRCVDGPCLALLEQD